MICEILLAIESEEERSTVENICLEYFPKMKRLCYNILKHPEDAEDAAMNAIARIADNAEKFLGKDCNETASLVVIYTRNAAISFYNRKKRTAVHTSYDESDELGEIRADESQDVERIVINNETVAILRQALRQLSDEQRDAIMLKYYYGYRYSEMTEILCADESTIRMRVFRAKNKLRELLGDEVYERMQF